MSRSMSPWLRGATRDTCFASPPQPHAGACAAARLGESPRRLRARGTLLTGTARDGHVVDNAANTVCTLDPNYDRSAINRSKVEQLEKLPAPPRPQHGGRELGRHARARARAVADQLGLGAHASAPPFPGSCGAAPCGSETWRATDPTLRGSAQAQMRVWEESHISPSRKRVAPSPRCPRHKRAAPT